MPRQARSKCGDAQGAMADFDHKLRLAPADTASQPARSFALAHESLRVFIGFEFECSSSDRSRNGYATSCRVLASLVGHCCSCNPVRFVGQSRLQPPRAHKAVVRREGLRTCFSFMVGLGALAGGYGSAMSHAVCCAAAFGLLMSHSAAGRSSADAFRRPWRTCPASDQLPCALHDIRVLAQDVLW